MEIQNLSDKSILLSLPNVKILFECPINLDSFSTLIPRSLNPSPSTINYDITYLSSVEISQIDLILISSCRTLRALPFLHQKFQGKILMTDPVSRLGQSLCEELIDFDEEYQRSIAEPSCLYKAESVKEIWRQVISLSYHQIYKFREISVAAVSSGHSLGSANWIIEWGSLSISYISESCMDTSRYPTPFNPVVLNSKVMIFSPQTKPIQEAYSAKKVYSTILEACRSLPFNCSIIIPIQSWQLLDLESAVLSAGAVFNIPTICMSPSARAFTSYAAGSVEWLSSNLRQKVYIPQNCFMFEQAKDKGMFHVLQNLKDGFGAALKHQNILMLADSSLRIGEADYIISRFAKKNNKHCIILVDEDQGEDVLKFHQRHIENFIVRTAYLNIALSVSDIEGLIEKSVARTVVVPQSFNGVVNGLKALVYLQENTKELFPTLIPKYLPIKTRINLDAGPVSGFISLKNYDYQGQFTSWPHQFKEKLELNGFDSSITTLNSKTIIKLEDASITFINNKVIINSQSRNLRVALANILRFK